MTQEPEPSVELQLPSAFVRSLVTVSLLIYLFVVVLGPLSNPIGSENLTLPLGRQIRPVHEAFYLGHGYRFFAPDPGPSHILEYRIELVDSDEEFVARLPDRAQHWPRLLYHRWFMLSETLYGQCSVIPDSDKHRQSLMALAQDIEAYRAQGELPTMRKLVQDRDERARDYDISRKRRDDLVKSVAEHLLAQHGGEAIELYLIERLIPRPFDVQSGIRLNDSRFLSEPRFIGRFKASDFSMPEDAP